MKLAPQKSVRDQPSAPVKVNNGPKPHSWRARNPFCLVAASVVVTCIAGCTSMVAGTAVKSGGPVPPEANVALLDPGNYPRKPRPPLGTVANENAGRRLEAVRMANAVVGPWEVDPALISVRGEQAPTTVLPTLGSLSVLVFGAALAADAARHDFLLGFTSGRASVPPPAGQPAPRNKPKILDNAVLRFASPADAAAAAAAMAGANLARPRADGHRARRLIIPGHSSTVANVAAVKQGFEAVAFTAHGPYVLYQFAGSKESADVVADLVGKTVELQGPLIDHFQPTPPDRLADLPADPTGLLARTVPTTDPDINRAAVYQPCAALHFMADPAAAEKMYADAGIQHVSVDRTTVLEAIDPTGAASAAQWLVRVDVPYLRYKTADGIVSGLPSARCFDRGSGQALADLRWLCIASVDRYAIKTTASQELDAHQIIASQYLMLTAA